MRARARLMGGGAQDVWKQILMIMDRHKVRACVCVCVCVCKILLVWIDGQICRQAGRQRDHANVHDSRQEASLRRQ